VKDTRNQLSRFSLFTVECDSILSFFISSRDIRRVLHPPETNHASLSRLHVDVNTATRIDRQFVRRQLDDLLSYLDWRT
jgi:hypothetical protein